MKLSKVFRRKIVPWTFIVAVLLVGATVVNITSASPETVIYVDPPVVSGVSSGDSFEINISVTEAPTTYAWEIYISWNKTLLELDSVDEGDFLHRWEANPFPPPDYLPKYTTTFLYDSLTEANAAGEIMIGCTLQGEVPWATGDGWLCTLEFTVEADGGCILDLSDTRLFDHIVAGSPAPTTYPNVNGFFYNVPIHDVAVTDVTAPSIVQTTYPAIVSVTVVNEGTSTETFDITLYNGTTFIDSVTVTALSAFGTSATETFSLDTSAPCVYNLVASADVVTGETDTADNTMVDGTVLVMPPNLAVLDVVPMFPELHGTKGPFYPVTGVTLTAVTVKNTGPGYSGYFDLIVLANGVPVSSYKAQTGNYLNLPPGVQATPLLAWVIYGSPPGTYYLTGYATPVAGEMDLSDNVKTKGTVTVLEADFVDWKAKVNHAAGTGIGHKSYVDATNLLEARVGNAAQDLVVRAMFEVRDAVGTVIDKVWSAPATLAVGQFVTLTASWDSPSYPGLFYITAYLFYGTQDPVIENDDFSQTLVLRVDVKPQ